MTTADILAAQTEILDLTRAAQMELVDAQAYLRQQKEAVADQEDRLTAEALEQDGLSNDAKRKAAVAEALRGDALLRTLRGQLAEALTRVARAEADMEDGERRLKAHLAGCRLEGDKAVERGAELNLQAFTAYLQAARVQLQAKGVR